MRRAVFLDRDGVIIENRDDYVKSIAEIAFVPGALDALARLAPTPFAVVVITNQSAIGRSIITRATAERIQHHVIDAITAAGGRIDGAYLCPHAPDEGCNCRKPEPGLILQAARELGIELSQSFFIGDALTDLEAARRAGLTPLLVLTGLGSATAAKLPSHERHALATFSDVGAAIDEVLALDGLR